DHAFWLVFSDDFVDCAVVGYVELFDFRAGAQVVLEKVGLAAVLGGGGDHVLASGEEGARGVQADEDHAADQQRSGGHGGQSRTATISHCTSMSPGRFHNRVCRAGRSWPSGNIFSHSALMCSR